MADLGDPGPDRGALTTARLLARWLAWTFAALAVAAVVAAVFADDRLSPAALAVAFAAASGSHFAVWRLLASA